MKANKGVFVRDIRDGQAVAGLFLVKDMNRGETKAGKPYLSVKLMDVSGEIDGKVWDNAETLAPECPAGAVVAVSGQAQVFKDSLQLRVVTLSRTDSAAVDMGWFVPATLRDVGEMERQLVTLATDVPDPHIRALLRTLLTDVSFMEGFRRAPAAKSMHHAYLGGLLEHTLSVAELAVKIADHYPAIDRSLLIAGAILHDIGKTVEFSYDSYPFGYTDRGRLVGHLVIATEMVGKIIGTLPGFPPELADCIQHMILSHHGQHDFGAPTLPMTLEAIVLHFIDDLDAKVHFVNRLAAARTEPGYGWTDYQRVLERFLFVQGHPGADAEAQDPTAQAFSAPEPLQRKAAPAPKPVSGASGKSGPEDRQPSLF